MKTLRIGNAAGFWGDSLYAPKRLAEAGGLDYLTLEYLAELTMSVLANQQARDPSLGYVTDLPLVITDLLPALRSQPNLRVVTNAGGVNPQSCAQSVSHILAEAGLGEATVAVVDGDNLLPELERHRDAGEEFLNLETGRALSEIEAEVGSAHAYLGARGIVDALKHDARIVITGRVADASLVVGPCVHEFGWGWDDWQKLATATVAGHIIECGAQCTGGMYSDLPLDVPMADVGYPIAEMSDDHSFTITKPEGTGGLVTVGTVSEQLMYEIGDPSSYLTPDVDTDFTQITLTQEGTDRVRVTGARGKPAPPRYKVSLAYQDGYAASATLVICGPHARQRARQAAEMVLGRVKLSGYELARTNYEILGGGDSVPGVWPETEEPWEVVVRISAHDKSKEAVARLTRELAPLVTSGPPGVTGYVGPRARPHRVLSYWPTTISREHVAPRATVRQAGEWIA